MSRDNIVVGGVGDACRGRVVGVSIVPREGEWFKETYIVIGPGRVVVAREPYSLPAEPPRSDDPLVENSEATTDASVDGTRWSTGIEDGEDPLLAAAIYMVDPRPIGEVSRDMEELVGREMAKRITSPVWRIALGEGYTLDEWAEKPKDAIALGMRMAVQRASGEGAEKEAHR